jgi:hypothetical protein
MVDWGRGYGATIPAFKVRAVCAPPLFRPSSPEVFQAKWHERPLLVKDGIGREMAGQFGLRFWLPRKSQGSFTCCKSATWDRRLYFPSEGRHAVDFFRPKNPTGSNPRSWVPEASMLTTRPPKPLETAITAYIRNISQADLQKVFANKIKWVQICIAAYRHHF